MDDMVRKISADDINPRFNWGRALPALGFDGVAHMRAGRSFSFEVDAPDEDAARTTATELADRLLANPVIEESQLELEAI